PDNTAFVTEKIFDWSRDSHESKVHTWMNDMCTFRTFERTWQVEILVSPEPCRKELLGQRYRKIYGGRGERKWPSHEIKKHL
ncbi:hypothetical protein, partial [Akkermansia sp. BIOML-A21]|uniref:hypothetical protein n=1 Tax=Akkermansia sp. BIOML-A21 TaxID=2584577 RepID=UPI0019D6685A